MSYRTHLGGDLRGGDQGTRVRLAGWVARRRDHGGLVFVDLRDPAGLAQLVFHPDLNPEVHEGAHELRNEFVIEIDGEVRLRSPETVNPKLATGEVEVWVERMMILSRAAVLPFQLDEDNVDEPLRLRHRYLDLRRDQMRHNLWVRFRLTQTIRRYLEEHGFWELETPILYKSTPEGAREFVVPTSTHPGKFYALPQSPQTFKQMYVIAGYERYYQIARCFRDEATRADRTAEFSQLDLEMGFVTRDELFELMEGLWALVWRNVLGVEIPTPFRRMTWDEAQLRYAMDKPDLRFGCEISDVTEVLSQTEFRAFRSTIDEGGVVRGFAAPGAQGFSRKDFDDLVAFAKTWGGKGVAWLRVAEDGAVESPIAKFLSPGEVDAIVQACSAGPSDTVFLVADQAEAAVRVLGPLRLHLGQKLGLIDESRYEFLWVTGFPMFEWLPDENRWKAAHHPFTSPMPEYEETFDSDPVAARSQQYDMVLNGNEVGGGSIRIHRQDVQRRVFGLLGISEQEAEEKFSFLLRALSMGAPPHGGIAYGIERMAMILAGAESLRDVTAFPKGQGGVDPLTGSPSEIPAPVLAEYGRRVAKPRE
ncbi:MAG: aspartate--tRNA ligase [Gaiellales bacterium]